MGKKNLNSLQQMINDNKHTTGFLLVAYMQGGISTGCNPACTPGEELRAAAVTCIHRFSQNNHSA